MDRRDFVDQLGRSIGVDFPPRRIISLVPSQTELLFDLGLDTQIVGITKFCNHPAAKVKRITKIGGTKQLNLNLIRSLQPDLIIGNKEENDQGQIETLMQEFPVWMSDVLNLDGALAMINSIGLLVDRQSRSLLISRQIEQLFNVLSKTQGTLKVAYLIWQKPYMVAAKNTFIDDMLQYCGCYNAFDTERYPQVTADELYSAQPDVIMLSSEPFPFKQKHVDAIQQICPKSKVILVDGEMFSWYGSRLLKAVPYFQQLISDLNNSLI
jgi:ABC-type Fe3+-hydroxamate transport system substrate-binding protein